jgi:hypothetical protein
MSDRTDPDLHVFLDGSVPPDHTNVQVQLRMANVTPPEMREAAGLVMDLLKVARFPTGPHKGEQIIDAANMSWMTVTVDGISFGLPIPEGATDITEDVPDPNQPGVGGDEIHCRYCGYAIVFDPTGDVEGFWVHKVTHDGRTNVLECETDMQSTLATPVEYVPSTGDIRKCKHCGAEIVWTNATWTHPVAIDGREWERLCDADMQSTVAAPEAPRPSPGRPPTPTWHRAPCWC